MKNNFVQFSHRVSDPLLDNPVLFNFVRFLLAGKQRGMKKFIQKYLNKYQCETIADFCCGTGDFAEVISSHVQYFGWDMNEDFINYAKKRYKNHKNKVFIKADVMKSSKIYKKRFDAVLLISTIHHFSDEELRVLLPQINNIVKKTVIVADIIPDPPHRIQRFITSLDRGRFIRSKKEKVEILSKYFNVVTTQAIPTRSAVQLGIVCEIKTSRKTNE